MHHSPPMRITPIIKAAKIIPNTAPVCNTEPGHRERHSQWNSLTVTKVNDHRDDTHCCCLGLGWTVERRSASWFFVQQGASALWVPVNWWTGWPPWAWTGFWAHTGMWIQGRMEMLMNDFITFQDYNKKHTNRRALQHTACSSKTYWAG